MDALIADANEALDKKSQLAQQNTFTSQQKAYIGVTILILCLATIGICELLEASAFNAFAALFTGANIVGFALLGAMLIGRLALAVYAHFFASDDLSSASDDKPSHRTRSFKLENIQHNLDQTPAMGAAPAWADETVPLLPAQPALTANTV